MNADNPLGGLFFANNGSLVGSSELRSGLINDEKESGISKGGVDFQNGDFDNRNS